MKKLVTLILILVLSLSFSTAAFAADEFSSNDGTTNVKIMVDSSASSNLSATVPLNVTINVNADGSIIAPQNYAINNTGAISVKVTHVTATAESGFSFTKADFNAAKQMNLTIKPASGTAINLSDYTSKTAVPTASAADWNVTPGGSLALTFGGNVYQVGDITTATSAFAVVYTIAAGTAVNS